MPAVDVHACRMCFVVFGMGHHLGNLFAVSRGMLPRFQRTWKFEEKNPFISTGTKTRCECNDFVRYQEE